VPPDRAPRSRRNLVNLEAVTKAYGTTVLLDAVSLGVGEGDRVGVVGRNGGGKSTLLGILTRSVAPDSGRVTHTGGLRVAAVGQADDLDPSATVRALVVGHGPAHEWAADPRVRDVLEGLFGDRNALDAVLDRPVGPLSGGERRRVALARALVGEHDLLVLDEPTNHLDVEGIDWLARHLSARREAVVVVTHDRWFLDAVCTRTWEVTGGAVHAYEGGYAAYVLARAERDRLQSAVDARRANLVRKELAWLRRGPPARTSKPRFRIDAANALIATEPPARDSVELVRFAGSRLGKRVYDVEDATVELGGRVLLDRLTWQLGPGDRVGLAGVNGSGKTSLLRLLTGELRPTGGRVVTGLTVRPAYLSQAVTELDPDLRVLEAVGHRPPPERWARTTTNVAHWATGVGWGVQFGLAAWAAPRRRRLLGLALGPVVWLTSYVVLPLAKVYKPIWRYDARTLSKDLSAHLVYGGVTSTVFTALGRRPR